MFKKFTQKQKKMDGGECELLCNQSNTIATKWQDTKVILSNCHGGELTTVKQKKVGDKVDIPCPTAIVFYNQMSGLYDMGRKSWKWRKKIFCMISVVNSWVIYDDLRRNKRKFLYSIFRFSSFVIRRSY